MIERKEKRKKNLTLKNLNFRNIVSNVSSIHRRYTPSSSLSFFHPPYRWLIVVDEFMGLGPSNTTAKHQVTLLNSCRRAILAVDRPTQAEIQAGFRLRIESEPKILGVFVCPRLGFGIKTENDRWLTVIPLLFLRKCAPVYQRMVYFDPAVDFIIGLYFLAYIYIYIFKARYSGISQQLGRAGWRVSGVRLRLSFKWIGQLATRMMEAKGETGIR